MPYIEVQQKKKPQFNLSIYTSICITFSLEVSISWGFEVLAPTHIVRGLENSQD